MSIAPPQGYPGTSPAPNPAQGGVSLGQAGGMPAPVTHDVTIVTTKKLAQAKVMGVPAEEWGVSRNTRSMQDCNYCFHDIVTKTEGDYLDEGYDETQIKGLETYTGNTDIETLARDSVQEHFNSSGSELNTASRLVKTTEHYIRMDYEGKGRACLYLVITGGAQGEILYKNKQICVYPIDVIPFATTTPVPITHRFFGRSIADLVMPVQREKTALKRGALDNMYLHNNPRPEISESHAGQNTLDDLLVARQGAPIRTKMPGGLNWQVVPDITASVLPMIQYLDGEIESRTGMTKQSQGLDANSLQNQSATAVAQVFSSSQMRMKLVARIIAEGVKDIFALLHHTIRSHGQEEATIRLRNSWITVDPRNWKTRDDMTINVGLGSGGKAQQFAGMMAIANFQKELLMGGKANLVDDTALYNTGSELVKILGQKNVDKFLNDPQATNPQTGQLLHPPVPPAPDPKLLAVQAKTQGDQQTAQLKAQSDQAKTQADIVHQQVKAQADIEVAKVKADLDAKIAIINAHIQAIQAEQKMRHDQQSHHLDVASTAMDMVATAHQHDAKMEQGDASHQAKLQQMKQKPKGNGK